MTWRIDNSALYSLAMILCTTTSMILLIVPCLLPKPCIPTEAGAALGVTRAPSTALARAQRQSASSASNSSASKSGSTNKHSSMYAETIFNIRMTTFTHGFYLSVVIVQAMLMFQKLPASFNILCCAGSVWQLVTLLILFTLALLHDVSSVGKENFSFYSLYWFFLNNAVILTITNSCMFWSLIWYDHSLLVPLAWEKIEPDFWLLLLSQHTFPLAATITELFFINADFELSDDVTDVEMSVYLSECGMLVSGSFAYASIFLFTLGTNGFRWMPYLFVDQWNWSEYLKHATMCLVWQVSGWLIVKEFCLSRVKKSKSKHCSTVSHKGNRSSKRHHSKRLKCVKRVT